MALGVQQLAGFGGGRRAAGGGTITQAQILALSPYAYWSLEDLANDVWQETTETNQADADTDPVGRIKDLSGNGYHADQATTDDRPQLSISGGVNSIYCPNSGAPAMFLETGTISSPPSDCSIFFACRFSSGETRAVLLQANAGAIAAESGSTFTCNNLETSGSPTMWVDGTQVTPHQRGAFYTSLGSGDDAWHVVEARACDISTRTLIRLMSNIDSTYNYFGHLAEIIIIPTANFTASDRTNIIIPRIQQQVGLA